jgi:general secretion pathway protein K
MKDRMKDPQKGIALLIVLWVLTVLMVMVLSFSVMTRADTYSLLSFKEGIGEKYLAEAGISRGIMEIIYHMVNQNQTVTLVGKEVWRLDGTSYSTDMGDGGCQVRIIDEAGKISLNGMTDSSGIILKNLLINQGTAPENADIIVDSILDWKDGDDLHRLNGAESDYYLSLPNPYEARNAGFETLDELIQVRGITPKILYGDGKMRGIIHFLSLANNLPQININVAPGEVLAALPGMNAAMAARIIEFRASAEIRGMDDVKDIIGDSYPVVAPYVAFASGQATAYTVEASGYQRNRKAGYSIMATVAFDSPSQYHYVYYKSPVDLKQ